MGEGQPLQPTIGRIVHYRDENGDVSAAIITRVLSDTIVNLHVYFDSDRTSFSDRVTSVEIEDPAGEGVQNRRWFWPPRV